MELLVIEMMSSVCLPRYIVLITLYTYLTYYA